MSNKNNFETAASAFISTPASTEEPKAVEQEQETTAVNTEEDYEQLKAGLITPAKAKKAPAVETRSKHMQSLVTPSLYKKLEKIAKKQKDSVNGVVNRALMLYILEQEQNEKGNK